MERRWDKTSAREQFDTVSCGFSFRPSRGDYNALRGRPEIFLRKPSFLGGPAVGHGRRGCAAAGCQFSRCCGGRCAGRGRGPAPLIWRWARGDTAGAAPTGALFWQIKQASSPDAPFYLAVYWLSPRLTAACECLARLVAVFQRQVPAFPLIFG